MKRLWILVEERLQPAGDPIRFLKYQVLPFRAVIQQAVTNKRRQLQHFIFCEVDRVRKNRIYASKYGLDGTKPVQILGNALGPRVVAASRLESVQVMSDRGPQVREGAVVEEGRLSSDIAQGRGAKLVAVGTASPVTCSNP